MTTFFVICFVIALVACAGLIWKNKQLAGQLQQTVLEKIRFEERSRALDQKQDEQKEFFNALQEQAKDSFKQLATESLKIQKEELVAKNADLYAPLKETMDRFSKEMGTLRTESAAQHSSLSTALEKSFTVSEELQQKTVELTTALKTPKTQGTWGEIILEDVLRSAGLREGEEWEKQVSLKTEEGERLQPDFIIHLPQKRDIIIDSKMSLNSYTQWANAPEGEEKQKFLKEHVRSVEEHIKELSQKDYPKLLKNERLDFTLMFIPVEHAYFAALQGNPNLNQFAREKHIALVTASNLLAILQLVNQLWQQEHSMKTVNVIFKAGQDMHERVARFVERMNDMHSKIINLEKAYQEAQKSLTGPQSILTTAKKIEQHRIKSAKNLPELEEASDTLLAQNTNNTPTTPSLF